MITILRGWSIALCVLFAIGCNRSTDTGQTGQQEPAPAAVEASKSDGGTTDQAASTGRKRRLFVSNYQVDTVSVLEGDPEMEVRTIPGGASPHGLAIRPGTSPLLAVAQSTGNGIALIDPDTLEQKAFIETSPGPQDVEFSPDGKRLYVVNPYDWTLWVIDADAMKVVGEPKKFTRKPRRLVFDGPRNRLYLLLVANGDTGSVVAVLNPKTLEIDKEIPVERQPQDLAFGNNGRTLATPSFDNSVLTVIDAEKLEVVATYPTGTGMGLAIHPSKPVAYSTESFDDTVFVVDLTTGEQIAEFSAGQWPTYPTFGSNGRYLYIPHEESDSVVKVDTETNQVVAKIAVGQEPIEVAVYEP